MRRDGTLNVKAMKIDLDEVIRSVVGVDPDKLKHADLIKQRLAAIDHTPDHPVYSVLIQEALVELNEGNGSSREAISQFIASKYDVLPIIHSGKLIEQLDKLVRRKEVLFTSDNCYVLPIEGTDVAPKLRKQNKRSRKVKQDHKGNTLCNMIDGRSMQEDIITTEEVKVLAHSVKRKAPAEVVDLTNIQGCLQVQQIGNKPLGQESQLTTEQERQQKEVGISARAELSMHELEENKDLIVTSSSSQAAQNLDLGLLLQKFDYKKETYVDSLKKVIALRKELSENIQYMSLVEESSIASSRPIVRELVMGLQSEIKAIFHSDIGSSSMQDYDLKELHLELHRVNLDFKDHALNCAERPLNSCSTLTSPNEFPEMPNYDFVKQQPEVPKNGDHLKQEQRQGPAQLKSALEKKTCLKEPESSFEDTPPGFGVMAEPEQHKIVNQNCELTVTELEHLCQAFDDQITLKGEEGKRQCEPGRERKRGVSSCDDSVDTIKTCLIELQKQREDSGAQMKKTSKYVSCAAIGVHVQQPIEADVTLNEDDLIVVGSSRPVDGEERVSNAGLPAKVRPPRRMPRPRATKSCGFNQFYIEGSRGQPSQPVNGEERTSSAGLPAKVKQPRRQLRPRAAKSRGCDQSPVEVISSDVDVVLLPSRRSKRQKKSDSPIQEGDKRNLFSKDETLEHSRWLKKSRSQELVRMHQQQLQKELQSPPSQTGHCSGEDSEELLSVHKEQQDDPEQPSEKVPRIITRKEPTPEYAKQPRGRQQKLVHSADKLVHLSLPSKRGAKQSQGLSLDLSEVKPLKSKPLAIATASTRKIALALSRESEGRITRARAAANEAAAATPSPKCGRKRKLSERLLAPEQQGADR